MSMAIVSSMVSGFNFANIEQASYTHFYLCYQEHEIWRVLKVCVDF